MSYASPFPGPPGPPPPPFPGPPPRRSRTGLVVGLVIGGVVVVVAAVVAAVVVVRLGGDDAELPAPRTLGRDPVPAEHVIAKAPANCGVGRTTPGALRLGAKPQRSGDTCVWSKAAKGGRYRELSVQNQVQRSGPTTLDGGRSPVAAAISLFSGYANDGGRRPLAGLGDDSAYRAGAGDTGDGHKVDIVFRTGNVVNTVRYAVTGPGSGPAEVAARTAAFRAATDVARRLGGAHKPVKAPPIPVRTATVVGSGCDLVPADLSEQLLDDDSPAGGPDHVDALVNPRVIPGASSDGCHRNGLSRLLDVSVTSTANANAGRDVAREYLRTYYQIRAARPAKPGGGRYFQALSGLGDRAFCGYAEGRAPGAYGQNLAQVVVHSRTAIITVMYGSVPGTDHPISREQAVNGAYALAVQAARHVK